MQITKLGQKRVDGRRAQNGGGGGDRRRRRSRDGADRRATNRIQKPGGRYVNQEAEVGQKIPSQDCTVNGGEQEPPAVSLGTETNRQPPMPPGTEGSTVGGDEAAGRRRRRR